MSWPRFGDAQWYGNTFLGDANVLISIMLVVMQVCNCVKNKLNCIFKIAIIYLCKLYLNKVDFKNKQKRSIKSVCMCISDHVVHHKNIYTSLISNTKTNLVNLSTASSYWLQEFSQPVGQPELKMGVVLEKSEVMFMKYLLRSA